MTEVIMRVVGAFVVYVIIFRIAGFFLRTTDSEEPKE